MNRLLLNFITNIHKPFDELNVRLSQQIAVQPDVNDAIHDAINLSVHLKHFCDLVATDSGGDDTTIKTLRKEVDQQSSDNKIMSDIADMSKHARLKDKSRHNKLHSTAAFEFNDQGLCRYLRTIIWVVYNRGDKFDFIEVAARAINYWINRQGYHLTKAHGPIIANSEYSSEAYLFYDPSKTVFMDSTSINTFRRDSTGELKLFDPPLIKFVVYEKK